MRFAGVLILLLSLCSCTVRDTRQYSDESHFSEVFSKEKEYRIYLPENYFDHKASYPVIYFLHGWGGRHFKDDNAKFDYIKIDSLVKANDVILVMLDGNYEESEPRPYNVGNHGDVKYELQFKDYFLEIVRHIDSKYRTLTDRNNRAIIGYSMGGFMSYFLAGKYPHMVCAATNLTGSPEFFIGYPANHTLYPLRYTFENLHGVKLRFHNSTRGELAYLNQEVVKGAYREKGIQIEYEEFEGGHKVDLPGEISVLAKAFDFTCQALRTESVVPERWNHLDIYPDFDVWGYKVISNKEVPGFIQLRGVTKNGFGLTTKKWLLAGPVIPDLDIKIQTPPLYKPNSQYTILEYDIESGTAKSYDTGSDDRGRLSIEMKGQNSQFGIWDHLKSPEIVFLSYRVNDGQKFLSANIPAQISIQILNRGSSPLKDFSIVVNSEIDNMKDNDTLFVSQTVKPGESKWIRFPQSLHINPSPPMDGSPAMLRFNLEFLKNMEIFGKDEFDLPVFYSLGELTQIQIDDGRVISDSIPLLGKGNGNGLAEAGESIVIYSKNNPLRLYYDTPFIRKQNEEVLVRVLPAKWPDGYTQYSLIKIEENTPIGQKIMLQANYQTMEYMPIKRVVHWGNIELEIE